MGNQSSNKTIHKTYATPSNQPRNQVTHPTYQTPSQYVTPHYYCLDASHDPLSNFSFQLPLETKNQANSHEVHFKEPSQRPTVSSNKPVASLNDFREKLASMNIRTVLESRSAAANITGLSSSINSKPVEKEGAGNATAREFKTLQEKIDYLAPLVNRRGYSKVETTTSATASASGQLDERRETPQKLEDGGKDEKRKTEKHQEECRKKRTHNARIIRPTGNAYGQNDTLGAKVAAPCQGSAIADDASTPSLTQRSGLQAKKGGKVQFRSPGDVKTKKRWNNRVVESNSLAGEGKRCTAVDHASHQEFTRTPLADVQFVSLNYPFVRLQSNDTVAQCVRSFGQGDSCRPIVYFNQHLTHDTRFTVTIEESQNTKKSLFVMGVTTCSPAMLNRYFYHVNNECRYGQFECKGYSLTFAIYSNEDVAKYVNIEKAHQGALARLTTFFTNGKVRTRTMKDMTKDQKLSSHEKLYPFLILDGSATKVKLSGEKLTKPTEPMKQNAMPEASLAGASLDLASPDSWLLARGIKLTNGFMVREGDGSRYVICKGTISSGQEHKFTITQIDQSDAYYGTITLGLTTTETSKIDFNCLAEPLSLQGSKKWNVCCNVLPTVSLGDEISILVDQEGVHLKSPKSTSLIMASVPPRAHLLLHFGGKVKAIKWTSPTKESKHQEDAEPQSQIGTGTCCICLSEPSDHILLPCGHICVCGDCVGTLENRCPICTKPVASRQKVYFS